MKLKGRTGGSPNQRRGPLRKIVQVLSVHKNSVFDRNLVLLECGHKTASNGIYKTRCWKCSDDYRALLTLQGDKREVRVQKLIHMCLDVRGALANWSDREMRGVFKDKDGRVLSVREAKDFLMDEIAKGHRVIPIGDCDAFDFETGCPGHPV